MNLIAVISNSDLNPAQQMEFIKTLMAEGVEATLFHFLRTLKETSNQLSSVEAELHVTHKKVESLQAKLEEKEALYSSSPSEELSYDDLEYKLAFTTKLLEREKREHKRTMAELRLEKQKVAIYGSLE